MFDYKIIFFIVPLIIVLILAYREINNLKQNIADINNELRQQTTNISTNVNQCVDRIEKISKIHITELQNINKINAQRINKVNTVCVDSDNETEGLSRNYISPEGECEDKKKTHKTNEKNNKDDLYMSSESIKLPIYEPEGKLYDDLEDEEDDDENDDGNDEQSSNINKQQTQASNGFTVSNFEHSQENSNNLFSTVLGIISMNDMAQNNMDHVKEHPIIEPVSEHSSKHTHEISNEHINDNKSDISEFNISDNEMGRAIMVDISDEKSSTTISSHKTTTSKKSSSRSSESTTHTKPNKTGETELVTKSTLTDSSKKTSGGKKSQRKAQKSIVEKTVDEYTLQELKSIAKENGITITTKVDGKLKQYKKSELYDILKKIKN